MRTRDPYMHRPSNSRHETVMTRSRRHLAIATARLRQKPPRCVSFALACALPVKRDVPTLTTATDHPANPDLAVGMLAAMRPMLTQAPTQERLHSVGVAASQRLR